METNTRYDHHAALARYTINHCGDSPLRFADIIDNQVVTSSGFIVTATGDIDGNGYADRFTALRDTAGWAHIYRSETGDRIGERIHSSDTTSGESIQALTLADTDGDGRDEFFAAFHRDGDAAIYGSDSGLSVGERIF